MRVGGAPAAAAHAAARAPIKDCGDVATLDVDGVFNGAITAPGRAATPARDREQGREVGRLQADWVLPPAHLHLPARPGRQG